MRILGQKTYLVMLDLLNCIHDTDSIIRMSFTKENFNDSNIASLISFSCKTGINIFRNLKEYF